MDKDKEKPRKTPKPAPQPKPEPSIQDAPKQPEPTTDTQFMKADNPSEPRIKQETKG